MKRQVLLVIAGVLTTACFAAPVSIPTASVTVRVVDEFGSCVSGITVRACQTPEQIILDRNRQPIQQYIDVLTDTNGEAHLTFPNQLKEVYYRVNGRNNEPEAAGFYYDRGGTIKFSNVESGKWQPWDAKVTHVIRPIVNPIPMYARIIANSRSPVIMPELSKPFGFDLIKSDWVKPDGKGEVADFVMRLDVEDAKVPADYFTKYPSAAHRKNATFSLTFSRPDDGIQDFLHSPLEGSAFVSPRFAPTDGYGTNLICIYRADEGHPYNDMDRPNQNYIFRIRSERDNHGVVTNALYGKIYGPFVFYPVSKTIIFTYYLNPSPNSRNLEFDPKRSLFESVFKKDEFPRHP